MNPQHLFTPPCPYPLNCWCRDVAKTKRGSVTFELCSCGLYPGFHVVRAFISFSSSDRDFVDNELEPFLTNAGIEAFEMEQINAGEDFQARIRTELARSDWVIIVISGAAAASAWVRAEARCALSDKPDRVLHVCLDDTDPGLVDLRLPNLHGAHWHLDPGRAQELLREVLVEGAATSTPSIPAPSKHGAPGVWAWRAVFLMVVGVGAWLVWGGAFGSSEPVSQEPAARLIIRPRVTHPPEDAAPIERAAHWLTQLTDDERRPGSVHVVVVPGSNGGTDVTLDASKGVSLVRPGGAVMLLKLEGVSWSDIKGGEATSTRTTFHFDATAGDVAGAAYRGVMKRAVGLLFVDVVTRLATPRADTYVAERTKTGVRVHVAWLQPPEPGTPVVAARLRELLVGTGEPNVKVSQQASSLEVQFEGMTFETVYRLLGGE